MAEKIDMSLDDIIKSNRSSKGKGNQNKSRVGGNRGNQQGNQRSGGGQVRNNNAGRNTVARNGSGPVRNSNQNRQNRRSGPYNRPQIAGQNRSTNAPAGRWAHDKFQSRPTAVLTSNQSNKGSSKLNLSNLHYRVSDQDLRDLFSEFGQIKSANVFYDKSGRSLGNAQVVFSSNQAAESAKQKYQGVLLDGRKMIIKLDGEAEKKPVVKTIIVEKPVVAKPKVKRLQQNNRSKGVSNNNSNRGKPAQKVGQRKQKPTPVTQEQLDRELDAFRNSQA